MGVSNTKQYKVHTLERGLDLIELLADGSREKSLSQLSKEAGFARSTTHRILNALKHRGYVRQDPTTTKYSLTLKLLELAKKNGWLLQIRTMVYPILKKLAFESHASAFLFVQDGFESLCIERVDGNPFVKVLVVEVGGKIPLHIGGGARAIFAHLPHDEVEQIIKVRGLDAWTSKTITSYDSMLEDLDQIRKQGYSVSQEDVTEGVGAVGCPVFGTNDELIGAISAGGLINYFSGDNLHRQIKLVTAAASQVSSILKE